MPSAFVTGATGFVGLDLTLGGAESSYLDFVRVVGEVTGRNVPSRATPAWLVRAMGRLSVWTYPLTRRRPVITPEVAALATGILVCHSGKAARELGYREAPIREMVEDCFAWLRKEGRL